MTVPTGSPASKRLQGVDVARALAIFAMFAAHIGPTDRYGALGRTFHFLDGLAPVLFVVVAGMGTSMLTLARNDSVAVRIRLLWTAALLAVLGFSTQALDHHVFVILQHFSVLFLVAALVIGIDSRRLAAAGFALAVLGPLIYLAGLLRYPELFARSVVRVSDSLGEITVGLLINGIYPALTYIGIFLVGMWLGRLPLGDRAVTVSMIRLGALVAAGSWVLVVAVETLWFLPQGHPDWRWIVVMRPHSQMPMWFIATGGFAVALIGICLALFRSRSWWSLPLVAVGQMSLTLYVLHLLAFTWFPGRLVSFYLHEAAVITLLFCLVATGLAMLWVHLFKIGPLEYLVRLPWSGIRFRSSSES